MSSLPPSVLAEIEAYADELMVNWPPLTQAQKDVIRQVFGADRISPKPTKTSEELAAEVPKYSAAARQADRRGIVYYVERGGYIKIGTTTNLAARTAELARAEYGVIMPPGVPAGPVTLLAQHTGGYAAERVMHRRFKADRVAGEWFAKSPELLAHIAHVATRNALSANQKATIGATLRPVVKR